MFLLIIRNACFAIVFWTLGNSYLFSQLPPYHESWRWTRFSTDDGLPSNHVTDIVESPDGVVWAKTVQGLAYYNGYHWTQVDTSLGLPDTPIEFIRPAPDGNLLVLNEKRGLYKGTPRGFHQVILRHNNEVVRPFAIASLRHDSFLLVHQDYKLYIWDKKFSRCAPFPYFNQQQQTIKLWNTESGNVWIQNNDGLYCVENEQPILKISTPAIPINVDYIVEDSLSGGYAMVVYPPEYHGIWTWKPHAQPRHTEEGKRHYIQTLAMRDSCNPIYSYLFGEIRTLVNNVWRSITPLPKEMTNIIFFRYRPNGDLWVATESGLNLFSPTLSLWKYHNFPAPSKSNIVGELLLTKDGTLWAGSDSGIVIIKPDGSTEFLDAILGQKTIGITGLAEDSENNIWVSSGVTFKGAYRWNKKTWSYFGSDNGLPTHIHRIRNDSQGRLWFLGLAEIYNDTIREPGAFCYDKGKFIQWGTKEGLVFGRVYSFAEGRDGSLWFGTNGGLACWKNGEWKYWTIRNGLISDRIFSLAIDSTNTVWFSHQNNGIGYLRGGLPVYLTASDGLVNDFVWEIKVDSSNRVWTTTSNGLACLDNGNWSRFDDNIRLTPLRLWPIIPTDKKVYIGTLGGGVAIMNLDYFKSPPPMVKMANPVIEKQTASFRWQPFSFGGELTTYDIETRYRLDNQKWSPWNKEREKFYVELPAGKHHFTVQAKSAFGNVKRTGYQVTIMIDRPYYEQPGFLVPLGSLSLGLLLLGFVLLVRKRKHDVALKLSEERYRGIIRDQTELLCRIGPDGTLRFVNEAFCRYFNDTSEHLLGLRLFDLIPSKKTSTADEYALHIHSLTPSNPTSIFTQELLMATGELRWIEWGNRAFFDEKRTLIEIQGAGRDITEQKRMEKALRQSEQDYRGLFENAHDAIIIFEPQSEIILEANQRACDMYGFDRTEFIGLSVEVISENIGRGKEQIQKTLTEGFYYQFETVQFKKDGTKLYLEINASLINYQGHDAILSINRDVTQRKLTEFAIARREAILEALSFAGQQFMEAGSSLDEKIHNVIMRLGIATNVSRVYIFENHLTDGGTLLTSQRYEWVAEGNPSQAENPDLQNFSFEESGFTRWQESFTAGNPLYGSLDDFPETERLVLAKQHILSIIVVPIFVNKQWWGHLGFDEYTKNRNWSSAEIDALQTAANILGAVIERQQREKTVTMLAQAIKGISECVSITDLKNNILFVNEAFCATYGYAASELIGNNIVMVSPNDNPAPISDILPATVKGGWQGELINKKKDGAEFPIFLSTSPVKDEFENPIALIGIAVDITERKRVEKQLREQASLLNVTSDAIIVENINHTIVYWNPGAERLYGWKASEIVGANAQDTFLEKNLKTSEHIWSELLSKGEWLGELKQTSNSGREITVDSRYSLMRDDQSNPASVLIVNTDITERKILEEQFLRSQRLESIGTLAGGIAHDLNNVLAPILLSVDLMKRQFSDPQSQSLLSTLETSATRGKDIIKQVLTFARGIAGERITLNPAHLIKEIAHIIRETFPRSIRLEVNIPQELWKILGDPTQIHQALLNISLNARDAMPNGGALTITAENKFIDEMFTRTHLKSKPGAYVSITISDNGKGIPAEEIDKIFDPFFTTKDVGKGTGLGLSTVHAIMKGHDGFITLSSEIGRGSSFTLYFPVSTNTDIRDTSKISNKEFRGNGEIILVVDDEDSILDIARKTLEMSGYTALTATDGTDAIAIYAQRGKEIQLVVTDIMMPYMDGISLIRSLKQIEPSVKIIAASGQQSDANFLNASGVSVHAFLSKPFTSNSFLATIQSVLYNS